jgi:hypothetical protein
MALSLSACGTTEYIIKPQKALEIPTTECEQLKPLVGEGEIGELELLTAISGWADQYDSCAGKLKVLIEAIKVYNGNLGNLSN